MAASSETGDDGPETRPPPAKGRLPGRGRWMPVLVLGVLAVLVGGVLGVAWLGQPENPRPGPPSPDRDPATGEPMFNRGGAAGGGWAVSVWTEGRVLLPGSTLGVVIDLVPPVGEPPAGTVRVTCTGANARRGSADFDLGGPAAKRRGRTGGRHTGCGWRTRSPASPAWAGWADSKCRSKSGPGPTGCSSTMGPWPSM